MAMRDNRDHIRGPLIFLLCHYCRVGGPPKLQSKLLKVGDFVGEYYSA